jgi:tripartite-type tricarboxylate transporter receptor subunit TctC
MFKWLGQAAIALSIGCVCAGTVSAQAYPSKAVRIVVPFAAGGGTDVIARYLAAGLTESLKHQVIVDNRAGANAIVGTEHVVRAGADGYTLLFVSSPHMVNPSIYAKLPYDTLRDFAPVSLIALSPYFLVVHPSLPARNVKEFVALAKRRPDEILYGSGGTGSSAHLTAELFNQMAGVKLREVPFKGAGPALIGTITGEVAAVFGNALTVKPHIESGRLRALGIASARRSPSAPDDRRGGRAGVQLGGGARDARARAHAARNHRHAQRRVAQGHEEARDRGDHAAHGGGYRVEHAGGIRPADRLRNAALGQGDPRAEAQAALEDRASRSTLSSISRASASRLRGARRSTFASHGSCRASRSSRSAASVPG